MAGIPPPPGVPPLGLFAMREPRFTMPIPVNRGREVPYEELVPGKHYYLERNSSSPMSEFEFIEAMPHHSFRAKHLPSLRNVRNRAGNPLYSVYEPLPPHPAGASLIYEEHAWPHFKFYEVSKVKRTGRFINPNITKKAKRQAVINALNRRRLSTAAGTGPTNTILKFAGLQPPRKTSGGKRRKTQKQKGGTDVRRLRSNARLALRNLGNPPGLADIYYFPFPEQLDKAYAMIIGPRLSSGFDDEIRYAKYPFEECPIFFDITYPNSYPADPPKVEHMTPHLLTLPNYRIHPNLYEEFPGKDYTRKVCLNMLNTFIVSEWNPNLRPKDFLNGIKDILESDPGKYEPGMREYYTSPEEGGILYNQHTFAECLEITCTIYKAILQVLPYDATPETIRYAPSIGTRELPPILQPFVKPLALRAYSSLNYLIQKVGRFIELNHLHDGKKFLEQDYTRHKKDRNVDFLRLRNCLRDIVQELPPGLRIDIFEAESLEARDERLRRAYNYAPAAPTGYAAAGNGSGAILPPGTF